MRTESGFRLTRLALTSCFRLRDGAGEVAEDVVNSIATRPSFAGVKSLTLVWNHLSEAALHRAMSAETATEFRRRFDPRSRFE